MSKFGFDLSEVEVEQPISRDPLPEGEYTLTCIECEEKETQTGGTMLAAKFEVIKGDYTGRWLWNNYNIVNRSEKAQAIARRQLASWAAAAGKPDASDTDHLLDRPFRAIVGLEKGTNGYADRNIIRDYLLSNSGASPAPKTAAAAPSKPATKPATKPVAPSGKALWSEPDGKLPWDE